MSLTTLNLVTTMKLRGTPHEPDRSMYRDWIRSEGWRYTPVIGDDNQWSWDTKITGFPMHEAIKETARQVSARLLREIGWYAPYEYGTVVLGKLCRTPGTWELKENGQIKLKRNGGEWCDLRRAMRVAGITSTLIGVSS